MMIVTKKTFSYLRQHVAEEPALLFQQEQSQKVRFVLGAEAGVGVYRVKRTGSRAHPMQRRGWVKVLRQRTQRPVWLEHRHEHYSCPVSDTFRFPARAK